MEFGRAAALEGVMSVFDSSTRRVGTVCQVTFYSERVSMEAITGRRSTACMDATGIPTARASSNFVSIALRCSMTAAILSTCADVSSWKLPYRLETSSHIFAMRLAVDFQSYRLSSLINISIGSPISVRTTRSAWSRSVDAMMLLACSLFSEQGRSACSPSLRSL